MSIPRIPKDPYLIDLINHPRCRTSYVVKNGSDGVPEVVATIREVPPATGMGPLWVSIVDHQHPDGRLYYVGVARGCGYNKFQAAVDGMTIGGHVIAPVHNSIGNICYRNKWLFLEA